MAGSRSPTCLMLATSSFISASSRTSKGWPSKSSIRSIGIIATVPSLSLGTIVREKSGGISSCEAAAFRVVPETISTLGVGVLIDFSDFPFESVVSGGSSGFFPSVGPAGATPSALPLGSVALGCSFDCFASVGSAVAAPSALPLRSAALGSSSGFFTLVGLAESDNCGLLSPPSPGASNIRRGARLL